MKLHFFGGAGTVTGTNYLLEVNRKKILVDCGLFQGSRYLEDLNYQDWPYQPQEIGCILVTHSHIDHIGRLPKLYQDGFRGKVFSTIPAKDLAEFLLVDSQGILKKEARLLGRVPLYNFEAIEGLMNCWQTVDYHQKISLGDNVSFTFYDAGHILGSAFILLEAEDKKIVFSGDLGNPPTPILNPLEQMPLADYALIESTYGDQIHEDVEKRKDIVEDLIEETIKAGGVLMIPAFAMERTQELLYEINDLVENQRVPQVPVFIDSPLAIKLVPIYQKYQRYFNPEAGNLIKSGDEIFNFANLKFTLTTAASKEINDVPPPKVIIAGAGMMQGGRILHHLVRYLSDKKNSLLIVAFQAEGSLGRRLLEGEKEVKILGQTVKVRARIKAISGYSAHADQKMLLAWLRPSRKVLKKVFVVQGEEKPAQTLALKIRDTLAVLAEVPQMGQVVEL